MRLECEPGSAQADLDQSARGALEVEKSDHAREHHVAKRHGHQGMNLNHDESAKEVVLVVKPRAA